MKPSRRRRGATLGLVAACVLVIIVLGVGVFFLAKLFGGGREVANATDAGTLNLAKNALVQPAVSLPPQATSGVPTHYSEFYGCAYPNPYVVNPTTPPPATIDLFTYNRCVGQAVLIALNAKDLADAGSSDAMSNAAIVLADLNDIGKSLSNGLRGDATGAGGLTFDTTPAIAVGQLGQAFSRGANKNNTGMYGSNSGIDNMTYKTAYMKSGGATNVFFGDYLVNSAGTPYSPTSVANLGTTATSTPDPTGAAGGGTKFYLTGYSGITVSAGGQNLTFYGVPVMPQQKPHLVSTDDFNQNATDTFSGNVPPNAFRVDSASQDKSTSGNFGGAVACAIVGAVFQNTGAGSVSPDFPVAIPTGFIALVNPAGNNLPANFLPIDNSANVFNNELYDGPGGGLPGVVSGVDYGNGNLNSATSSSGNVFGDMSEIQAWVNYDTDTNTTNFQPVDATSNPLGKDPAKYPPTLGYSNPPSSKIFDKDGTQASKAELLTLTGPLNDCTAQNGSPAGLSGNCLTDLENNGFTTAYGHSYPAPSGSPPGGVSAVDTIKGAILANFNGAGYHSQVNIGVNGSNQLVVTSTDGHGHSAAGAGNGASVSTGLGEYMGSNGLNDVYATPNPSDLDQNRFPIQNTGATALPSAGAHPTILGLLAQLDSGNGTDVSGNSSKSPNASYNFQSGTNPDGTFHCNSVFQAILNRVKQIQPACHKPTLEKLLNGPVETSGGTQPSLLMGQTAYIFLNHANLADTSGVTNHGLRIYAASTGTVPAGLKTFTNAAPDGVAGTGASSQCGQTYSLYKNGAGMVDVSIAGNGGEADPKGDDSLHDQPYTNVSPGSEYTAKDTAKWIPSSGYGNILGQLTFSDVVSGSASFSSPN